MPNETRNDDELPCYLDIGGKLFPEAPEGQRLDLTDPGWRDQALTKHIIREGQAQGYKPVKIWLLSHQDIVHGSAGTVPTHEDGVNRGKLPMPYDDTDADFYGEGGGQIPDTDHEGDGDARNFYHEQPVKVFSGPFEIRAEYQPSQTDHVLTDFGIDRPANDVFNFLIEDAKKLLGRVPNVGDLIERFDGLIFELLTSVEFQAEHFEWLYQQCGAYNTQKDISFFGG